MGMKEEIGYVVVGGVVCVPGDFMNLMIERVIRDGPLEIDGWRLGLQALSKIEQLVGKEEVVEGQVAPGVAVAMSHRGYPFGNDASCLVL